MADVTNLLEAIERGDPKAAEQLLPLVYDELRELAALKLGDPDLRVREAAAKELLGCPKPSSAAEVARKMYCCDSPRRRPCSAAAMN